MSDMAVEVARLEGVEWRRDDEEVIQAMNK